MKRGDDRLVAALVLLRDGLSPVVDQVTAGELESEDRADLARALRTVADQLDPPVVIDEQPNPG
jgi:hypothetical protein